MKVISWPALAIAVVYAVAVSKILIDAPKDGDAEEILITSAIVGFPGSMVWVDWRAVAFNAVVVYGTFACLLPALNRAYRKYSRPPE